MRKFQKYFVTISVSLGVIAFVSGCLTTRETKAESKNEYSNLAILQVSLSKLNLEEPKKYLEVNLLPGDLRFKSVCGYVCAASSVGEEYEYHKNYYGTDSIEGTSDVIEGDEHGILIMRAEKYAEQYNRLLTDHLSKEN